METMAALGARSIRVDLRWDLVARSTPVTASDPEDSAYDWTTYDRVTTEARRAGLAVFFTVWGTPEWAVDPTVPADAGDPAWGNRRPRSAEEFGAFGAAAVRRYSDQVRSWEVWNEPNMNLFLRPQYERRGDEWVAVGPDTYAALLTAFADAARSVEPDVRIVSGGVAPVGDRCNLRCSVQDVPDEPGRLGPGQFLTALATTSAASTPDVVAAHLYPSTPPPRPGAPPRPRKIDIDNLEELPRALEGTPFARLPIWATEYGWQTQSTEALTYRISPAEQAQRVADTLGVLSRFPRIQLATYYFLQDNSAFASGLFEATDDDALTRPKPATDAFALPVARVADDEDGRARLVGQVRATPGATEVNLEAQISGRWEVLTTLTTRPNGTFAVALETHGRPTTVRVQRTDGGGAHRTSPALVVDGERP